MNIKQVFNATALHKQAKKHGDCETFYFESEGVWLSNIFIILIGAVLSLRLLDHGYKASLCFTVFVIFFAFIRFYFQPRSPECIDFCLSAGEIHIKHRTPRLKSKTINICNLKEVRLYKTISSYPMAVVELRFENQRYEKILFELDGANNGFLSLPQEVIPDLVKSFVNTIDLYIKNGEK